MARTLVPGGLDIQLAAVEGGLLVTDRGQIRRDLYGVAARRVVPHWVVVVSATFQLQAQQSPDSTRL